MDKKSKAIKKAWKAEDKILKLEAPPRENTGKNNRLKIRFLYKDSANKTHSATVAFAPKSTSCYCLDHR